METLLSSDQHPIRYVSLGRGQAVIFLHGWTSGAREWLPFATELSDNLHTFCWDARGHGQHPPPRLESMQISQMADDLEQLLEHHGIRDAVLVGHSMGALISWEYIRNYGLGRLAGICIVDQSPKLVTDSDWPLGIYGDFDYDRNQAFIQRLGEDFAEGVLELAANGLNPRSRENYAQNSRGFQQMRDYLRGLNGPSLTRCWDSLTQQDYRELLPTIDRPALMIYGDTSQFYTREVPEWIEAHLPHPELHIYPKADHSPHLWHKEQFAHHLRQWIRRL
ncbi:alpha/beta fold hydrolase [Marinobacterium sediminicola]|uniref:Pimeloyl-ACP methyl ester carboxylesterase n=1 Tax=Marinobacterium sediminicola TaxID=518898 RepID=A0ABY1S2P9_9GAMM|nr:alpha/beta hydrolase [Marinobacterium sediminicola]ULG70696.1 alpha/beta hydrolase [Marinobacterium sediminicola]SMR77244.1 Pimeloyl-ACP methyl ester carboxylesterase [Marinobacterium sediminicola]